MAVGGKVEILPMMYLALSYDHPHHRRPRSPWASWSPVRSCWKTRPVCCWMSEQA